MSVMKIQVATSKHCPVATDNRTGALTVEFAIVAPIIFLLFLGSIELTTLNLLRHTAANAAYEGARKAIIPGGTDAAAEAEARGILEALGARNDVTVSISRTTSDVTVTVIIPVARNSWGLSRFSGSLSINKSCMLSLEDQ